MYRIHQTTEVRGALVPLPTETFWLGTVAEYIIHGYEKGWEILAEYPDEEQTLLHWRVDGAKRWEILADFRTEEAPVGFTNDW